MLKPAIPKNIIHQTQLNNFDCLATCIAMVSGVSQYDIQGEMELLGLSITESMPIPVMKKLLARHNIITEPGPSNRTTNLFNQIYIETVPYIGSNKIISSAHSIVVDRRKGERKFKQIYDPYKGVDHKYYYTAEVNKTSQYSVPYDEDIVYSRFLLIDCNVT